MVIARSPNGEERHTRSELREMTFMPNTPKGTLERCRSRAFKDDMTKTLQVQADASANSPHLLSRGCQDAVTVFDAHGRSNRPRDRVKRRCAPTPPWAETLAGSERRGR